MTDDRITKQVWPMETSNLFHPKYKSELSIGGLIFISSTDPVPNRWRRFWYWALLGWEWRPVTEVKNDK
jgi:hypothetical protein